MLKILMGIILFAIAFAIIYAWGYVKSQRSSQKLQKQFKNRAEKLILNTLEGDNQIKKEKLEDAVKGLEVKGSLFSGIRYKVTNPKEMVESILDQLERKNIIKIINRGKNIKYKFIDKE